MERWIRRLSRYLSPCFVSLDELGLSRAARTDLYRFEALVHDRRFEHFQPILDLYIEQQFCSTTAHTHLVRSELRLVENYGKADAAQDLRASIKVWPYLFKLIVKSRALQRAKEGDINITASHIESAFRRDLQLLLKAINSMMRASTPPSIIGTQGVHMLRYEQ
jgi:dedicator of cytokinesis protein 3